LPYLLKSPPNCDKLIEMNRLYLLLPMGIIAVSTASIFIKLCDAPVLIIATYRMMLASLMLTPFACYQKRGEDGERMTWDGFFSPVSS